MTEKNVYRTILVDENIPLLPGMLEGCGNLITFSGRGLTKDDILEYNGEFLVVRSTTKVNRELLEGTKIKFVGTATSGTDHVDLDYLGKRNIKFADAPGSNANSVAEYVVFSIAKWALENEIDLAEKTIGIIGYGNIGKIVAEYARRMGIEVLVNDPPLLDEMFKFPTYAKYMDLNDICAVSDIITNHVPLTKKGKHPTFHLFSEKQIELINNGALLIHASRGFVVQEEPLLKRLENGDITAAIDVWENEPLVNAELANLTQLATPHVAGYSRDGKLRGTLRMARAFEEASGLKPDYSILEKEMASYHPLPPEEFSDTAKLHDLLKESRKLEEDTRRFRESLQNPPEIRKEEFDRLRKEYPKRRELL